MIRIVCNWNKEYGTTIYEFQIFSLDRWYTMKTFYTLLEGIRKYGTAIMDEYEIVSNKLT